MSHLNSRDYGFVSPSDSFQVLNSDTEFHSFNREASRRQLITRAWIVGLVVVCGVVLWRVLL